MFQHTAARRRLPSIVKGQKNQELVSTHSRPKAAAWLCGIWSYFATLFQHTAARRRLLGFVEFGRISQPCFNTQPPEGGCLAYG